VRFLMLLLAVFGLGVTSLSAVNALFPQQAMFAAAPGPGPDAASFRLADLNFIRAVYDDVIRTITSPNSAARLNIPSSPPIRVTGPIKLPEPIKIDQTAINRAIAAGMNARIQQDYQPTQAIIQYGRNPMAWHGPPPH
jgi:hypothetical protein